MSLTRALALSMLLGVLPAVLPRVLPFGAGPARADYQIDRFRLAGGGVTTSTGGGFELGGSVGLLDDAVHSGGPYLLDGGFWLPPDSGPSAVPPAPEGVRDFHAWPCLPNPARRGTELVLDLPSDAPVRIEAFSVTGALVAVVLDQAVSAGRLHVAWNLAGDDGRLLPSGVYLLKIQAAGAKATLRLVVLQ